MVLQDEAAGGAGDCRSGTRGDSDRSGEPTPGISELDAQYPRLDAFAATLVGTPDPSVVLQGEQAHYGGARDTGKLRDVRVDEPRTGSRCSGHVVQFRAVAVFHAR